MRQILDKTGKSAPQEETLTPRQRCFFASVLLLNALAFSSVFAYAFMKRAQAQKTNSTAPLSAPLRSEDLKRTPIRIVRGSTQWDHFRKAGKNRVWSRHWSFSRFPGHRNVGPRPMPQICVQSPQGGEWGDGPLYVVMVPPGAELGLYVAHFQKNEMSRDFRFEVVPEHAESETPSGGNAKADRPLVIMPADIS